MPFTTWVKSQSIGSVIALIILIICIFHIVIGKPITDFELPLLIAGLALARML